MRKTELGFSIIYPLHENGALGIGVPCHNRTELHDHDTQFSQYSNQNDARLGFTLSTTVIFFCVGAASWSTNGTLVEALIAMNIVIVYGIFLNGQIDGFLQVASGG